MSHRAPTVLLLLAACTLRPYEFADGASATTSATDIATTSAPQSGASTTTPTTTGDLTTSAADTGLASTSSTTTESQFVPTPDLGLPGNECDQWIQDCPEGQKCMPYDGDGDNAWESLKCVDIVPDPDDVGEECTVFGSAASGEDTCDKGQMCWDVIDGAGHCVGMCIGSPDQPTCEQPMSTCTLASDGVLTLCLPLCSPLAQDCPGDRLCLPNPMNPDAFICVGDAFGTEGQVHDPCEYTNACDKGLVCLDPVLSDSCDQMAQGCCVAFCDTMLMGACTTPGEECLPWYEMGQAPPGYENVGVCGLPQ